ncbi:nitroreductase family deazaflavin-dependent oxidoreductase [Microbacterium sp. zg.B48]|uniref:nitroreductase family deazaflavin-dependent oxidoreductase n=1 Tax=Microbacterium sp. zg.B48 TaxID=2969408 RepID=UPI00214C1DB6|nr:nitroreductase family deazaflavin-dependent oxidoreductase [Microbacterium sp. zg.B48]MCR2764546.1 nitroreductase family deazaflavin-dependent oxidoreductase [Microbacterium sp. zg.B48]
MGRVKTAYLHVLNRTLNPIALGLAKRGRGPFSVIRSVGRRSGRTFETPVILAESSDGLVAELTYGDRVNWYRNILHGGGHVIHRGRTYRIVSVEPLSAEAGLAAYGPAPAAILRVLHRREFRLIRVEAAPTGPSQGH